MRVTLAKVFEVPVEGEELRQRRVLMPLVRELLPWFCELLVPAATHLLQGCWRAVHGLPRRGRLRRLYRRVCEERGKASRVCGIRGRGGK